MRHTTSPATQRHRQMSRGLSATGHPLCVARAARQTVRLPSRALSFLLSLCGELACSASDALISRATAEMAGHRGKQSLSVDFFQVCGQSHEGHDDAGRAKAALEAVLVTQRLLDRMQRAVGASEPFDSRYFRAIGLNSQHEAGSHRFAVDDHSARAANAMLAPEMHAGIAG